MVATSLSESNANNAVETFVTTISSSEKPQHVILQKDNNNKPPSPKAQSPSAEGFNQTKTSIQVHTPSTSSKSSHSVGSSVLISERENNRPLPNPIKSGGQKVTLVTRQNDPDHAQAESEDSNIEIKVHRTDITAFVQGASRKSVIS